jgi:hypothetical protein
VVVEVVLALELLAQVVVAAVVMVQTEVLMQLPLELPILVAAVVVVLEQTDEQVQQAVPVSSSLNTTHPHNPYSHSKAQPSG